MPKEESPNFSTNGSRSGGGGSGPPKVTGGSPEPDRDPEAERGISQDPPVNEVSISLNGSEKIVAAKLRKASALLLKPFPLRISLRLKGRNLTKVEEGLAVVEAFVARLPKELEIISHPNHAKREVYTVVVMPKENSFSKSE